jgi:hypothetical protein
MAALDHTIVFVRDRHASSAFLAEMIGAPPPTALGHFMQVPVDNGVTLDFMDMPGNVSVQHYAFLVSEAQFDKSFAKIRGRGQSYWADPYRKQPGQIGEHGGGKIIYFEDPSGHFLELRTRPSR